MRRKSVRAGSFSACFLPIMSLVGIIGSGLVLAVGGDRYLNGLLEMGTLYAFFLYAMRLWEPIYQISAFLRDMQEAQAAGERIIGLLAEEIEIKDRPEVLARYPELPKMQGRVSFKDLNFSYIPGEPVLENFNLEVPAGSTVAIVGETGAGKSTLVNLLCRFYEPQSGKIEIDGRDIREMPLAWIYHNLGYVLQTPHLFSGTIAENIRYGKPKASDEEVREAAKLVHADRFIQALPQGYDSQVGEAGSRLSTGQKQLISFARAVIGRPALFVLDEATSSVDTEAEKDIQEAIDRILSGSTAFIVAHRLSTIRDADIILLIEDGKICEQGDHAELMAKRGKYFNLYSSQFTIANKFDSK